MKNALVYMVVGKSSETVHYHKVNQPTHILYHVISSPVDVQVLEE